MSVTQVPDIKVCSYVLCYYGGFPISLRTYTLVQVHVSRVRVAGLKRTKSDIVVEQIKDVLKVTSLRELIFNSIDSMKQLERLNIFNNVSLFLDTDKSAKAKGAEPKVKVGTERVEPKQELDLSCIRNEDSVEVTFFVEERGLTSYGIAANAGTQSGDAVSECTYT